MIRKKNKQQYSLMMRISLLSVSLVLATSLSVSAAVPQWGQAFPGHSSSAIELIATMPSLAVIMCLIAAPWIARKFGDKRTVIWGLVIAGIFGTLPVFVNNYYVMLFSRLLFGVGLGIINGLAVSLIGVFFKGQEKNQLMGWRSGFEMLGNAVAAYIAGVLLVHFGWHYSFLIYLLAFPVAVLFYKYVPNPPKTAAFKDLSLSNRINKDVIFWAIMLALYQTTYVAATVKIAGLVEGHKIGTVSESALIISIAPLFGLVGGMLFGKLELKLHKYLFPVAVIFSGLFELVIAFGKNIVLASAGMFLVTLLDAVVVSYVLNISVEIAPPHSLSETTSLLLIGSNCGIFLAPIVCGSINQLFNDTNPSLTFAVFGIFLLIGGAIGIWDLKFFRRKLFK